MGRTALGHVVRIGLASALTLSAHCASEVAQGTAPGLPEKAAPTTQNQASPVAVEAPQPASTAVAAPPTAAHAAAGAAAAPMQPQAAPAAPIAMPSQAMPSQAWPDPRGGCPGLQSGFPGDDACIAPPAPGQGLQIHVGPSKYDDPAEVAKFVLHPGEESSECWSYHTPNAEDVYFQGWTLSGRPGTHHIFNSMLKVEVTDGGDFHVCVDAGLGNAPDRLGSLPGAARPYMPRLPVAPENEGFGQLVKAHTPSEADMHYFNTTDKDILREFWLNLYFIPKDKVTQEPLEVRGMGGLSWVGLPIAPGTDEVYKYECPIASDGRLISMLGHYHAHGKRETVSIRHSDGKRDRLFEMYDYNNAALFLFDSLSKNPPLKDGVDGAVSGRVDLKAGDVLEWECHIVNDGNVPLTYSNSVKEGEMCNVFGMSVGPEINCLVL